MMLSPAGVAVGGAMGALATAVGIRRGEEGQLVLPPSMQRSLQAVHTAVVAANTFRRAISAPAQSLKARLVRAGRGGAEAAQISTVKLASPEVEAGAGGEPGPEDPVVPKTASERLQAVKKKLKGLQWKAIKRKLFPPPDAGMSWLQEVDPSQVR